MSAHLPEVTIARHGETEWSLSGQHTGRSDIPLTARGESDARKLRGRLDNLSFAEVLVSPLQRAVRTCELAGFAAIAEVVTDLAEWDYGDYEGLTTSEIRRDRPDWSLFRDGCPGGESLGDVSSRADRVVSRLRASGRRILLFSHGHFSRILAARWIGLPAENASHLLLGTGSVSILGYEHSLDDPAIVLWNEDRHLISDAADPIAQPR